MSGKLDKVVKMREQAQVMDDECGSTSTFAPKKRPDHANKMTAEVYFRQPRRYEECVAI